MIFNTLKILMKDYKITQTKLAEQTNITRPTLLSLIRNDNKSIRYDVIEGICKLFNIDMNDFLIYTPLELEIKDFDMYYFKVNDEEDFNIESNVFIDGEKFTFTHLISDINEGLDFDDDSYDVENNCYNINLHTYLNSKQFYYFKDNNLEDNLNLLVKMKDEYTKLKEDVSFALESNLLSPPPRINFTYSIERDPNEFNDFRKIIREMEKLSEYDKNMIYKYLKNKLGD